MVSNGHGYLSHFKSINNLRFIKNLRDIANFSKKKTSSFTILKGTTKFVPVNIPIDTASPISLYAHGVRITGPNLQIILDMSHLKFCQIDKNYGGAIIGHKSVDIFEINEKMKRLGSTGIIFSNVLKLFA
jgi:hypothetical protein